MASEADKMVCPKCGGDFETKEIGDEIKLSQCHQCFGLFVPPGMTRKILANWGPDTMVDTGSEHVGKKYDKIDDIDCPKCGVKMDKIEDLDQPHIWIESCAECGGTFFDAGELTDLKQKTLSDWFKRFTKGSRK